MVIGTIYTILHEFIMWKNLGVFYKLYRDVYFSVDSSYAAMIW